MVIVDLICSNAYEAPNFLNTDSWYWSRFDDNGDVNAAVDRDTLLLLFVIFASILICLFGNSLFFRFLKCISI
jgi:hypothetical protein